MSCIVSKSLESTQSIQSPSPINTHQMISLHARSHLRCLCLFVCLSVLSINQIAEDTVTGLYRFWVFIDDHTLQPIIIKIPRLFYINTRKENFFHFDAAKRARSVERVLPKGRPTLHLYEVGDVMMLCRMLNCE